MKPLSKSSSNFPADYFSASSGYVWALTTVAVRALPVCQREAPCTYAALGVDVRGRLTHSSASLRPYASP